MYVDVNWIYLMKTGIRKWAKAIKKVLDPSPTTFEVAFYIGVVRMKLSLWVSTNKDRHKKESSLKLTLIIFCFPMKLATHITFGSTQSNDSKDIP